MKAKAIYIIISGGILTYCGIYHNYNKVEIDKNQSGLENYLKETDLSHGESQLVKMLNDRPEMALYDLKKTEIWEWMIRKYGGEDIGINIYWNSEPPQWLGINASHKFPTEQDNTAFIRIRSRKYDSSSEDYKFESSWNCAIFEMNNISHASESNKMYYDAVNGILNKDEFIEQMTKIEYKALKKTKKFYENIWLPIIKKKNISSNPKIWNVNLPNEYEKWIKKYKNSSRYPWVIFGKYYDEKIIPYLNKDKKFQ